MDVPQHLFYHPTLGSTLSILRTSKLLSLNDSKSLGFTLVVGYTRLPPSLYDNSFSSMVQQGTYRLQHFFRTGQWNLLFDLQNMFGPPLPSWNMQIRHILTLIWGKAAPLATLMAFENLCLAEKLPLHRVSLSYHLLISSISSLPPKFLTNGSRTQISLSLTSKKTVINKR